jgi:hypothetical protein
MKATYVSRWDGNTLIKTSCQYDPKTSEVTDVEASEDAYNIYTLEEEYIELPDGTEIRDFICGGEVFKDGQSWF